MVKIRLSRQGRKGQPHYLIVAIDARKKRDSKSFLEILGFYNSLSKEIKLNRKSFDTWIEKGAQPTLTVQNIFKKVQKSVKV